MAAIVPTITTDNQAFFDESLTKFSQFSKRIQIDASTVVLRQQLWFRLLV